MESRAKFVREEPVHATMAIDGTQAFKRCAYDDDLEVRFRSFRNAVHMAFVFDHQMSRFEPRCQFALDSFLTRHRPSLPRLAPKTMTRLDRNDCLERLPCVTTTRMGRRHLALCSLLVASSLALGCEDDSTSTDEGTQVEPPTMELTSPTEGACISIGTDPEARIPFVLKTSWLYLRPPGICGDSVQCGHLVLWIDDKIVAASSTSVIEWNVASVIDRYGEFHARIAAVTDEGANILDAENLPLEVTRTITTAESCPNTP